ncbi:MAG: hypothetical protein A3E82_00160 [Gammaproteobacteria bacterium RIFCSPHIGHO2_12_FULL_38_11]|nr:MAG: hypothetical protein A3E82_00160 [Gammaproteobacteria bacterium RIFCSPHIGHO2_12_FULL_38_11]
MIRYLPKKNENTILARALSIPDIQEALHKLQTDQNNVPENRCDLNHFIKLTSFFIVTLIIFLQCKDCPAVVSQHASDYKKKYCLSHDHVNAYFFLQMLCYDALSIVEEYAVLPIFILLVATSISGGAFFTMLIEKLEFAMESFIHPPIRNNPFTNADVIRAVENLTGEVVDAPKLPSCLITHDIPRDPVYIAKNRSGQIKKIPGVFDGIALRGWLSRRFIVPQTGEEFTEQHLILPDNCARRIINKTAEKCLDQYEKNLCQRTCP